MSDRGKCPDCKRPRSVWLGDAYGDGCSEIGGRACLRHQISRSDSLRRDAEARAERAEAIARQAEANATFLRERETRFASMLRVCDAGRYRADWASSIEAVVEDRNKAEAEVIRLLALVDEAQADQHEVRESWARNEQLHREHEERLTAEVQALKARRYVQCPHCDGDSEDGSDPPCPSCGPVSGEECGAGVRRATP